MVNCFPGLIGDCFYVSQDAILIIYKLWILVHGVKL